MRLRCVETIRKVIEKVFIYVVIPLFHFLTQTLVHQAFKLKFASAEDVCYAFFSKRLKARHARGQALQDRLYKDGDGG